MKAVWNDTVIAESNDAVIVEGNHYFPFDSIKEEYFQKADPANKLISKLSVYELIKQNRNF